MLTELFETELFICIKMDSTLNNLQRLTCHKTQTSKPNSNTKPGREIRLETQAKKLRQ